MSRPKKTLWKEEIVNGRSVPVPKTRCVGVSNTWLDDYNLCVPFLKLPELKFREGLYNLKHRDRNFKEDIKIYNASLNRVDDDILTASMMISPEQTNEITTLFSEDQAGDGKKKKKNTNTKKKSKSVKKTVKLSNVSKLTKKNTKTIKK